MLKKSQINEYSDLNNQQWILVCSYCGLQQCKSCAILHGLQGLEKVRLIASVDSEEALCVRNWVIKSNL